MDASNWLPVKAGNPKRSILGSLFFLVYINDLTDNLTSTVKLFADNMFFCSIMKDPNISAKELNKDSQFISEWAYKWKMTFNLDKNKQAQEVVFSRK